MSASLVSLPAALREALIAGTEVITPNKRLARRLVALYDGAQRMDGRKVWPGAVAMLWEAWLRTLWQDLIAGSGRTFPRLLPPAASAYLWERVVNADGLPLMDRAGAAARAAEAWHLMHAWGTGSESWQAWRDDHSTEDTAAFARWAEAYRLELARRDCIDSASLADAVAAAATEESDWIGRDVCLAGFIEMTPQQQRVLEAFGRAGMRIVHCHSVGDSARPPTRAHPATPREEIVAALTWAAGVLQAQPDAQVAVVIEDLAARRGEVMALAQVILDPGAMLPGAAATARPFDLSLGEPLATLPLPAAALAVIGLASDGLPMGEAAALLRSPYLPAGPEGVGWVHRSPIEHRWLEAGCKVIDFDVAIDALIEVDGDLARRWIEARRQAPLPSSATPREWVDRWRAWLERCGWPGDRGFESAAWQARQAWEELLTGFAELATVAPRLSRDVAWSTLRRIAQDTLFAPASPPAPIAILGVLEAAGLPFDAIWVAGLTAERWPPAPAPNPFLPVAWQRERGVPRSSPARELAYAQTLTAVLARGAPEVVMSSARRDGDTPLLPSALLLPWPERRVPKPATSYSAQIASTSALEALDDTMIPPLPPQSDTRGGAYLIGQFADCPFQAVADSRLNADPWPMPLEGLSAMERGTLIHAALAHFWRETRDQASLLQLTPESLSARVAEAALRARAALTAQRWQQVAPAVVAGESMRLMRTLTAWLAHERDRPAFVVEAVEAKATLAIGGLRLQMRLDRVDTLADGGIAIIDYKGGRADRPGRWFDAQRPRAPQLGLYALARRAMAPETAVRAVAYVQLRPDTIGAIGLAADVTAWPGLTAVAQLRGAAAGTGATSSMTDPAPASPPAFADWSAVEAWWQVHLGAVAGAYAAGHAGVAPRDPATCGRCGRQLLCRIGRPADPDDVTAHDA